MRRQVTPLGMRAARLGAGGLAAWAFTLPWAAGTGRLAGHNFAGIELARFANDVRAEGVGPAGGFAGALVQVAVILAAVAVSWLAVLALLGTWHRAARYCSGYLLLVAVALAAWSIANGGPPLSGALALGGAAALSFATNGGRLATGPVDTLPRPGANSAPCTQPSLRPPASPTQPSTTSSLS